MVADGQRDDPGSRCRDDPQLVAQGAQVGGDGVMGQQHPSDAVGFESFQDGSGVFVVAGSRRPDGHRAV